MYCSLIYEKPIYKKTTATTNNSCMQKNLYCCKNIQGNFLCTSLLDQHEICLKSDLIACFPVSLHFLILYNGYNIIKISFFSFRQCNILVTEAAVLKYSAKKCFKIFNIFNRIFYQESCRKRYQTRDPGTCFISYEFCKAFQNTFLFKTLLVNAFGYSALYISKQWHEKTQLCFAERKYI